MLPSAAAQAIGPTVCIEYPYGSATPIARFGYVSTSTDSVFLAPNSPSNNVTPTPVTRGVPDTFYQGRHDNVFSLALSADATETWNLTSFTATALSYQYLQAQNDTTDAATAVCPMQMVASNLSYSQPGTYQHVFLAQVDSGPSPTGVTLSALSVAPGVSIANLTYVPGDAAQPKATSLNPNSIYGDITITKGKDATTQVILELDINGVNAAESLLPITYTGPIATSSILVTNVQTPLNSSTAILQAVVASTGAQAPSGAVTFKVDNLAAVTGSCTLQNLTLACQATYPTGTLSQGRHTITVAQAADFTYPDASGSGELDAQAIPVLTWIPQTTRKFEGFPLGNEVLDATSNVPGTFQYFGTANGSSTTLTLDATTALPLGQYMLYARFTPADQTNYSPANIYSTFLVSPQTVFVLSAAGGYSALLDTGTPLASGSTGGGQSAAVDAAGNVWSVVPDGSGLARISNRGVFLANYNVAGQLAGAKALAIDGANILWITNGTSVVAADTSGNPVYSRPLASAAGLSAPSSIAIDASGSLWISNSGDNSATELIGVAAPTVTPIVNQVINSSAGTRP